MVIHPMPVDAEVFSPLYASNIASFDLDMPENDVGVGDQVVLRENNGEGYTGRWLTLKVEKKKGADVSLKVLRRGP